MPAAVAKFQFIEKEHLFIGICSLEKILRLSPEDSGLNHESFRPIQKCDFVAVIRNPVVELLLNLTPLISFFLLSLYLM